MKCFLDLIPKNKNHRGVGIALLSGVFLALTKAYMNGPMYNNKADLTNKVVIVTGGNAGIGYETAKALATMNATIIIACRDEKKSIRAVDAIKFATKNSNILFIKLDLSSKHSIRTFVEEFKKRFDRLHILINNAGVAAISPRGLTEDKFELQFGINHLGHFYLTYLLLDTLKASAHARVMNVSSDSHIHANLNFDDLNAEKAYHRYYAYANSKLANVLFTRELQRRYGNQGINAYSLHPGTVRTEIWDKTLGSFSEKVAVNVLLMPLLFIFGKDSVHGAQTTIYCAIAPENELKGGEYYKDCKVGRSTQASKDENTAKRLWEKSMELLGL